MSEATDEELAAAEAEDQVPAMPSQMPKPAAGSNSAAATTPSKVALDLQKVDRVIGMDSKDEFLTTARAQNDVAITVRGGQNKIVFKRTLQLLPTVIGKSRVKAAWRPPPHGGQLAVAAEKEKDGHCMLYLYNPMKSGSKPTQVHTLGKGAPLWLDWDCSGSSLAIHQENVGIWLWDVPEEGSSNFGPGPLKLAPSITNATSFCMWSKKFQQLAIGTNLGKVIIFNKPQGVMQLHDRKGKHGAPVTCGDWIEGSNRLGLASGTRVKISRPLEKDQAQWESFSKFKLSGMLSRVPRKFKDAGAPKLLSFSLASHDPFVAVCIGENYMLVFGTSGSHQHEDVGLTFPDDYGPITGFQWLEDDVVLVSLANGYVTSVDFGAMVRLRRQQGLPEAVKATGTTKVFDNYLTCLSYSAPPLKGSGRIACVGDKGFKVIVRTADKELDVLIDHTLDYELSVGNHIDSCRWDTRGSSLVVTATDGYLWTFELSPPPKK